jgi:hypothetical protein
MRPESSSSDLHHYFEYSNKGVQVVKDGLQSLTFGEYLVDQKVITRSDLFEALQVQDENPGVRLGECLAAMGRLSYAQVETFLRQWNRLSIVEA